MKDYFEKYVALSHLVEKQKKELKKLESGEELRNLRIKYGQLTSELHYLKDKLNKLREDHRVNAKRDIKQKIIYEQRDKINMQNYELKQLKEKLSKYENQETTEV